MLQGLLEGKKDELRTRKYFETVNYAYKNIFEPLNKLKDWSE